MPPSLAPLLTQFGAVSCTYLPYSIVDGWQQIRKDFAYWRAAVKGAETAATPQERAWFEADRRLREKLTLRDIGIWSHYVGDASQPLHVSIHYNGWGTCPDPRLFTTMNADRAGRALDQDRLAALLASQQQLCRGAIPVAQSF